MPKVVNHEDRQRELIEASWDVIAELGYEGLTLRRVASRAGCTTGRIVHYFSGRDALLEAALTRANNETAKRMLVIVGSNIAVGDKLHQVVLESLPLDARRLREWKVWLAFWSAAVNNPELAKLNKARYRDWRGLLEKLFIELSVESKDVRVNELLSMIDGLGVRLLVNGGRTARRETEHLVADWINRL